MILYFDRYNSKDEYYLGKLKDIHLDENKYYLDKLKHTFLMVNKQYIQHFDYKL